MAIKRMAPQRIRRPYKKRRIMRRKPAVPRGIRQRPGVLAVTRKFYTGPLQFSTASTAGFWNYVTVTAGTLPSFSEFSNVFDEYRILGVKVEYRPSYDTTIIPTGAGTNSQPEAYLHVLVDPASTLIPSGTYTSTNLNTFLENQGVRTYKANRYIKFFFRPKVADSLEGGSTSTRQFKMPWTKTTNTGVVLRGYHTFIQVNNFNTTNTNISLDTFLTYYMMFRNTR